MPTTISQSSFVHILGMLDKMGSLWGIVCLIYFSSYISLYEAKELQKQNRRTGRFFGTSSSTIIDHKGYFEGLSKFLDRAKINVTKSPNSIDQILRKQQDQGRVSVRVTVFSWRYNSWSKIKEAEDN